MDYFVLVLAVVVSWYFGMVHMRLNHGGWPKWAFLIALVIPVFVEQQAWVIFIAASFMLGFLYEQENSFGALFSRLKSVFTGRRQQANRNPDPGYSWQCDDAPKDSAEEKVKPDTQEPESNETSTDEPHMDDDLYEDIIRKREEYIRKARQSGGGKAGQEDDIEEAINRWKSQTYGKGDR